MRQKRFWIVVPVLALVLALLPVRHIAWAATVTVNSATDVSDGDTSSIANLIANPGPDDVISLREAIDAANNTPGSDTINFNTSVFPPASPATIAVLSPLPTIDTDSITIDGSGAGVIIDGSGVSEGDGFRITSDGNTIKGLQIIGFPEDGVEITNGAKNNIIGGDWTTGSAPRGEGNVITLNKSHGVNINGTGTTSNTVSGNLIGLDLDGTRDIRVQAMAISPNYASDQTLFIGTKFRGVWQTTDGGNSWAMVSSGLTISDVLSLAISPNYGADGTIFAGTAEGGIFKSTTLGISWTRVDGGVTGTDIRALAISPDYASDSTIFAGTGGDGVFASTDGGNNWEMRNNALLSWDIKALVISHNFAVDKTIFVSTWGTKVFKSTDQGSNWTDVSGGWTHRGVTALAISPNYANDQTIFAATSQGGGHEVFKSVNGGDSWLVGGNPGWCEVSALAVSPNYAVDQTLFAGDGSGIYRSTDGGTNWVQTLTGYGHWAIAISPAYVSDQTLLVGTSADGIRKSVDGGNTWIEVSGLTERGNYENGVSISDGAQGNVIGGDTAGERNIISNNSRDGVFVSSSATMSNTVSGNYIGTDAAGSTTLGNSMSGVTIEGGAQQNVIGGTTTGERNVISGNGHLGVAIGDTETIYNIVIGNYIGTDASGGIALGNDNGVAIWDGRYNVIGGDTAGERNLISGNGGDGVNIGESATGNTVIGNYIGTDVNGTAAISNGDHGVDVKNGAQYNVIGGDTPGERNLISGNGDAGVNIENIYGSGTMSNTVSGNYIGTDAAGTSTLGNGGQGVLLGGGAHHNTIGGNTAQDRNIISGNNWGVGIEGVGTTNNMVTGNFIGTDISGAAALGNTNAGVVFYWGSQRNTIGPDNTIAYNGTDGVVVYGSTCLHDTITSNSIYNNTEKGIELTDGGNLELFPPILTHVDTNSVEGLAPPNSTVEIFSDAEDEGRYFHGFTPADSSGHFTFIQASAFTGTNVTATATDVDGNTSEFSAPYEPLIDVQVIAILQPKSSGKVNQAITPTVRIGNAGTTFESGIEILVEASGDALSSDYAKTKTDIELPPLGFATLTFSSLTPDALGTYNFTATVNLAGDQNPDNDQQVITVTVDNGMIDLWMRDNQTDNGDIPTRPFWKSPDIWVRNNDDGGTVHQKPIAHQENWVYMIVRNRGNSDSNGAPDTLKAYWHEPSLGIKCYSWAPIGAKTIPSTPANNVGTQLFKFSWTPARTGHTCLLSEIVSDDDPVSHPCVVAWDNNISQRNVNVIPGGSGLGAQALGGIAFEVTNVKDAPKPVDIILDVSDVPDANAVQLDLGSDLSARWASVDGIAKSSGVVWSGGSIITVTNPSSGTIASIPMAADETYTVTLLVNAPSVETTTVTVYEAIDAGPYVPLIDAIVGGNTYIFDTPSIYLPIIFRHWDRPYGTD